MQKSLEIEISMKFTSRPSGGGGASAAGNVMNMMPQQMRNQINQQIGQAVTNAAMKELSNVFSSKK
jgi:hypothetical protein